MSEQDLKTPVPDDVARWNNKQWEVEEVKNRIMKSMCSTLNCATGEERQEARISAGDFATLIRAASTPKRKEICTVPGCAGCFRMTGGTILAATTPSTPTVSEEDKARALEFLDRYAEMAIADGFIVMPDDVDKTIRALLLPTPREEGS